MYNQNVMTKGIYGVHQTHSQHVYLAHTFRYKYKAKKYASKCTNLQTCNN